MGGDFYVFMSLALVATALQLWALIDAVRYGGWLWGLVVWFVFPAGALAWLFYGRRRHLRSA